MTRHLELVLAGLLHDIGKFAQRAFPPGQGLDNDAKALADYICPIRDGYHTRRHVVYTAQFILSHLQFLPEGMDKERILRLACYHHRPSNPEEKLVTQADWLSSGMEREDDEAAPSGGDALRRVRLRAIVNEVNLAGRAAGTWSIGLAPLDPQNAFPQKENGRPPDLTEQYKALWLAFLQDWSRNRVRDPWAFVNRAMSVLERYTWCIPSATNVYPDISLFDHLKTTAAIAGCLAIAGADDADPFLLVTGAFGGIQNFLFNIQAGAGGLARKLRARSLFVSLAVENVAHAILRKLSLPLTNCIISAGGRFTLLLPNTQTAQEALEEVRNSLDEWIRREVACELHPHMASLPIGRDGLSNFGHSLAQLGRRLEQAKARPLGSSLAGPDGWREDAFVLDPLPVAEEGGLCNSCRRRAGPLRLVRGRQVPVCDRCFDDTEMGRQLVNARYIAFVDKPGRLPFGSYQLVPTEAEIPPDAYLALDLDGGCGQTEQAPVVGSYVARFVPRDEDGTVTEFSDIAAASKGRQALAYLKADVDNLGLIFSAGLTGDTGERRSISRISTLSRSLELFFAGHVQRLASEFRYIYTVYSGGDDLLMVGPWDTMFDLAIRLNRDFRRYTCGNPSWSMSAGLVLVGQKTPVLIAVEEASRLLEAAKGTEGEGAVPWPPEEKQEDDENKEDKEDKENTRPPSQAPTKNRIVAFGTSLPWHMAEQALSRAKQLLHWLETGALSTGQVRRLLSYARRFQHWQRTGDILGFRYVPLLVYDINRNWADAPPDARQWAQTLTLRDSPDMPLLRFICEYALYGSRSSGEERDAQ